MNNPTAPPLQSIYPVLEGPQDDQVLVATEQKTHRLQHISRLQRQLEEERDLRAALYKKYHRGVNVLDGIDTTLITVSMGLGVGGVGLLSTIVAAPVVLGLEAGSLACGILAVAGKYVGRRLATKAKKHDEIRVLAKGPSINSNVHHNPNNVRIDSDPLPPPLIRTAKTLTLRWPFIIHGPVAHLCWGEM